MTTTELPRYQYTSSLTRKGQVTIPIEIRRQLGLKRGDKVSFVRDGDAVKLKPAESVAQRTAGALREYRRIPAPTAEEERAAFEEAVAEEVAQELGG